ncbi:HD domain-containing phosphohydrolase [Shewanella mangrovi]|uniref:HD domain-containing phosphohydrolase n=1 Tax=Shewanella mangrovi TaxID=1515746 RepID=UPI000AB46272|nr:HD domain-containing phosphohydrolase [Shewanella mangrovi]
MLLLFALLSGSFTAFANVDMHVYRVLVIHSYDPSYQWTKEIQSGIDISNSALGNPMKLSIEYLDAKRIDNSDYLGNYSQYLKQKYKNYQFDGVIITDDNALLFVNNLDMPNIKNLPTVAVGIGDENATLTPITNKGIVVYEQIYIEKNLDLILKLRPNIKNLYYLADRSVTSNIIEKDVSKALEKYPQINVIEIRDKTLSEASLLLQNVSVNDAVLLTHFNTETKDNIYHDYNQIAYQLGHFSRAPIFVFWKFYISDGVLGGYVIDSYKLGVKAFELLENQFSNVVTNTSSNDQEALGYVFSHQALTSHHIDINQLPVDSKITGKPTSFIIEHWRILSIFGTTVAILVIVIFVLFLLLQRKREINRKNSEILTLQKQTVNVQKDLIFLLGDVIETRSGETGNHVKRVAKMSALLANLSQLKPELCELIEMVSPMHDIGKIGIPEAILEKPGKLNAEEWEIMKTHVNIGYKILSSSEGDILSYASIIALEHHERWDGKGYPYGKSGEDIHIFARITAITDVFDALLSKRCYKKAWPVNDVIALFFEESAKQFDPVLTNLLLTHMDKFLAIRAQYPDTETNITETLSSQEDLEPCVVTQWPRKTERTAI